MSEVTQLLSEDPMADLRFPGTQWHDIGDAIYWNYYKHWATGYLAGEGKTVGHDGDRSGCLEYINGQAYTSPPYVVLARSYCLLSDPSRSISAVFSYPRGIGLINEYFWEIYPGRDGDPDRFLGETAEVDMEAAIKAILLAGGGVHA